MSWWARSEKKQTCTFVLRESVKLMPVSKWCCIVISATNVCNEVCGMSYTSIFSILLFLRQGDNLNYIIMLQHCCFCLRILFFKYSILVLLNFKSCEIKKIVGFFYLWRTVNNRGSFFRNFIEKKKKFLHYWLTNPTFSCRKIPFNDKSFNDKHAVVSFVLFYSASSGSNILLRKWAVYFCLFVKLCDLASSFGFSKWDIIAIGHLIKICNDEIHIWGFTRLHIMWILICQHVQVMKL